MAIRSQIFSGFGFSDERSKGFHEGVDLLAAVGTDVMAMDQGRVILTDAMAPVSGWGRYAVVAHFAEGADPEVAAPVSYTMYMHLDSRSVDNGDEIASGALLGTTGTTGYDPDRNDHHLHVEIWTDLGAASGTQRGRAPLDMKVDPSQHLPGLKPRDKPLPIAR
jgi:murein DD-endopeptidase MepM/ murein hydrolase activator NlpD